jgi:predicted AAA+ superfamily ATPase
MEFEEQYYIMQEEYDVIFSNLEQDPMYLAKAEDAHKDLCEVLDGDLLNVMQNANVLYDSTSENHYNRDTKEITLSLFSDHNDEQNNFIFSYLNDRYGLNLDSSDVKTNTVFTALHELGHYVDFTNKEMTNEYDSYVELNHNLKRALDDMEYGPEMWQAYRELPSEEFADKFAIDFMIKYFPELV